MARRPTKEPQLHSWAIYHIKSTPAQFVGIIDNAPDEQTAISRAIEVYNALPNERGHLIALLKGNRSRRPPPRGH